MIIKSDNFLFFFEGRRIFSQRSGGGYQTESRMGLQQSASSSSFDFYFSIIFSISTSMSTYLFIFIFSYFSNFFQQETQNLKSALSEISSRSKKIQVRTNVHEANIFLILALFSWNGD